MREIEKLARHGYRVLAYDHMGCMESGGASPNGLAQSLVDLNDCITAVKADARFFGVDISVVGHSWGAFSTMNVTALHPEISHIVAMCGFVSVEEMVNTLFSGLLRGYRPAILALERAANPEFSRFNAAKSLASSDTRALLIYSADDPLCRPVHYEILQKALAERDNVKFLFVDGKGHNPNYTQNAVKLLREFSKARARILRKKGVTPDDLASFVGSFDWRAMTEQDENIWEKIFLHLDS
jgi:pimeloyl-ACP methyl ester carboxylesterase